VPLGRLAKPHFGQERFLKKGIVVRDAEAAKPSPIVGGDGYREFLIVGRREAP